jgi:hypothetical protein
MLQTKREGCARESARFSDGTGRHRVLSSGAGMSRAPRGTVLAVWLGGLALVPGGCTREVAVPSPTAGPARRCDRAVERARAALFAAPGRRAVVTPAVADLMERPDVAGPLADQARFGDLVTLIPPTTQTGAGGCRLPRDAFVEVETAERYRGFVVLSALRPWTEEAPYRSGPRERVIARLANVYAQPDLTKNNPMLVLPLGVELRKLRDVDASARWLATLLPDGRTGYIQRGDVVPAGEPRLDASCIVNHSLMHDGTPYLWGGRSTLGIDCSGLVANAFAACGVLAPRDAHLQYEWEALVEVPKDVSGLRPGDLLFFGSAEAPASPSAAPRITHVGVYVSDGRFVHASTSERPAVHISEIGAPEWQRRWLGVRRHPQLAAPATPATTPSPSGAAPPPAP